jgi:hypothetical protein
MWIYDPKIEAKFDFGRGAIPTFATRGLFLEYSKWLMNSFYFLHTSVLMQAGTVPLALFLM